MNAIEFVKHYGINDTQRIVSTYQNHTHVTDDARMFINSEVYKKSVPYFADSVDAMVKIADLKQIVEAFDNVNKHGGLISSKKYLKFLQSSIDMGLYHGLDDVNYETEIPLMEKSINLVGQCHES